MNDILKLPVNKAGELPMERIRNLLTYPRSLTFKDPLAEDAIKEIIQITMDVQSSVLSTPQLTTRAETMIVCSYYTRNYLVEAINLKQSLLKHGIRSYIVRSYIKGSWLENVRHKAAFMLEMSKRFDCPIIWLDADAVVRKYPQILEDLCKSDIDFAAHWRDDSQLLSGSMFFNATPCARRLLTEWVLLTIELKDWTDQAVLQHVIDTNRVPGLHIGRLPASYCQIFDTMAHNGEPVIEHMQASRKHKTSR